MLGVGRQLPVGDLLGRILGGLALVRAVAGDLGVGQDPVQPRLEVRAFPERAEARIGFHHGFLQQVFGVGRVAGHPQGAAVELVEQRKRVALEARGQLGVGSRAVSGTDSSISVMLRNTVPSVAAAPKGRANPPDTSGIPLRQSTHSMLETPTDI